MMNESLVTRLKATAEMFKGVNSDSLVASLLEEAAKVIEGQEREIASRRELARYDR